MNLRKSRPTLRSVLLYPSMEQGLSCWLGPILSGFVFVTLLLPRIARPDYELQTEIWWTLFIVAGLLLELLNQITYVLGKARKKFASRLKLAGFWIIYTGTWIAYMCLRYSGFAELSQSWSLGAWAAVSVPLSIALPNYSFDPGYRFLLLHGRFERSD